MDGTVCFILFIVAVVASLATISFALKRWTQGKGD
jgi:hypothetical protein